MSGQTLLKCPRTLDVPRCASKPTGATPQRRCSYTRTQRAARLSHTFGDPVLTVLLLLLVAVHDVDVEHPDQVLEPARHVELDALLRQRDLWETERERSRTFLFPDRDPGVG